MISLFISSKQVVKLDWGRGLVKYLIPADMTASSNVVDKFSKLKPGRVVQERFNTLPY